MDRLQPEEWMADDPIDCGAEAGLVGVPDMVGVVPPGIERSSIQVEALRPVGSEPQGGVRKTKLGAPEDYSNTSAEVHSAQLVVLMAAAE